VFNHPKKKMKKQVEELKEMEDFVDQMQEELTRYLAQCAKENLNDQSAQNVSAMIRIINELENISDSCYNLILLSQRRYDKKILFSSKALKQIGPYTLIVKDFLAFNNKHLNGSVSNDDLKKAFKLERKINRYRNNLKKAAQRRLQKGSDVSAEILYIDTLSQIERIGDYSLRISRALRLMG
jgi:phosphate:Na+ symporter